MKKLPAWGAVIAIAFSLSTAHAADWTGFRGPHGTGAVEAKNLPTNWSAESNLAWKTSLPGAGSSSPIVLGDKIYLTSYSGYGVDADSPGEMSELKRHVLCLDRASGKVLWDKAFKSAGRESSYRGRLTDHGYATSTPTTDGKHLYVFMGRSGVYCLDLKGNKVWHKSVGDGTAGWGSSNSPVLYKNLVIINASIESRTVYALDKTTGKEVWKLEGIRKCWSTPLVVKLDEHDELVLSTPGGRGRGSAGKILGLNPETGKQLWSCEGIPDGYVCPTPIVHDGIIYVIGGRSNTAIAIRAGGKGDVTKTHRLWMTKHGSNVSSPVYHDGHIYWMHEKRGTAYCLDAKTGKVVYRERLSPRPGTVYSSVTVADGKIYCLTKHNGTFVIAAKPEFKLLAHNTFKGDESRANACAVVSNGQLLLRSDKYLYCVGKKAKAE